MSDIVGSIRDAIALALVAGFVWVPFLASAHMSIADWPSWIQAFTAIGSLFVGIAVWKTTLRQAEISKQQADISAAQAASMSDQTALISKQAEISAQALYVTFRPRLVIRRLDLRSFSPDMDLGLRYEIVNTGAAEATEVTWNINYIILAREKNLLGLDQYHHPPTRKPITMASGFSLSETFTSDNVVQAADHDAVRAGERQLLVFGVIAYTDGFANLRKTRFTRYYDPTTFRFRPSNDQDDEYVD